MAPRTRMVGTGITRRKRVVHDGQSLMDELKRQGDAHRALGEYAGSEPVPGMVAVCERILARGDKFDHGDDSEADFASGILIYHRQALAHITAGKADQAAAFAFAAGRLWATASMKWAWERDALTGQKNLAGSSKAGEATSRQHGPMRERRFARMAELVQQMPVEKAARTCEAEGMGGWQGIKRQWDRRKNRDT